MDVSNIINLGLFAMTALAVWVAIIQAKESRAARVDAESARDDAKRSAEALEQQAQSALVEQARIVRLHRADVAAAMIQYATARAYGTGDAELAAARAVEATAGGGLELIRQWVLDSAEQLREAQRLSTVGLDESTGLYPHADYSRVKFAEYRDAIRDRLLVWVESGSFDDAPLPVLPSFGGEPS